MGVACPEKILKKVRFSYLLVIGPNVLLFRFFCYFPHSLGSPFTFQVSVMYNEVLPELREEKLNLKELGGLFLNVIKGT